MRSGAASKASTSPGVRKLTSVRSVRLAGMARMRWISCACSGVAQRCEVEQRANCGQPGVSSSHTVAAVVLEVIEEGGDEIGIELGEVEMRWCRTDRLGDECQQEPERIAVGRNGVRADPGVR